MQLTSLPPYQVALFSGILVHFNNEKRSLYEDRVKRLTKILKSPLARPGFISRMYLPSQKSYTPLCSLHKPLNAKAVHHVFTMVSVEVGVRLNNLVVSGRSKNGRHNWDTTILNLRSLHGMWLAPDIMKKTFGNSLELEEGANTDWDYMTKWPYQADGCEACILARMAGELDTIMDLRLAVESRMFPKLVKKHGEPRLWPLIKAWTSCWKEWFSDTDTPKEIERRLKSQENTIEVFKANRKTVMREQKRAQRDGTDREKRRRMRQMITEQRREVEYSYLSAEERAILEKFDKGESFAEESNSGKKYTKEDFERGEDWFGNAPPAFGLPPMTSYEEAEKEHEAEVEVEEAVHDAENEVIDAYLALISTPFLPGMSFKQHAKAETVLSDDFVKQDNREQHRVRMSPYTEIKPIKGIAVAYSESAYSTDNPTHPQYVHPRSGWTKDYSMSQPKRSSIRPKDIDTASGVSSWVDASVPPSMASLNLNSAKLSPQEMRRMLRQSRYSAIMEEESPVSPISERSKTTIDRMSSMKTSSDSIRRRRRAGSPNISPITAEFNEIEEPLISPRTIRYNQREMKKSHASYPTPPPELSSPVSTMIPPSSVRPPSPLRLQRHKQIEQQHSLKPRLSRPFMEADISHINMSPDTIKPSRSRSTRTHDRPSSTKPISTGSKSPISRSRSERDSHHHHYSSRSQPHHHHHHTTSNSSSAPVSRPNTTSTSTTHQSHSTTHTLIPINPFSATSYAARHAALHGLPQPAVPSSNVKSNTSRRESEVTTFSGMMRGFDPALGVKLDEYDRGYEIYLEEKAKMERERERGERREGKEVRRREKEGKEGRGR